MRILNRPMFRYGGPIKEGVMHGMRNGGRAALVGNPVYPKTGGREHHQLVKNIPKYIKPGYWSSLGKPGTLGGKVKNWWLRNKPSWKTKPGVVTGGTSHKGMYGTGASGTRDKYISQMMAPTSTLSKAKSWVKENPYWAYGGTGVGMTSGAIPETVGAVAKGGYNLGKKGILQAADLLVHDKIFDQDKWFADREKAKIDAEEKLTADQIEINRLKELLEGKKTDKVIDPDAAKKLAKDQQNARLKSYLDMMGYDRSKKTALSDALIDASALVQDATTEAGSLKKADWGKLINRAIQTTSKRLDKPEQIREAVGLMATKAAIQKDLEDPQVKELRALQIEEKEKLLNAGPSALITAHMASRKGSLDAKDLAILMRDYGIQNDIPVGVITKTQVTEEYGKDGKPALDIIEDKKITEDGIYVIGKEVIQITDGKPIQLA